MGMRPLECGSAGAVRRRTRRESAEDCPKKADADAGSRRIMMALPKGREAQLPLHLISRIICYLPSDAEGRTYDVKSTEEAVVAVMLFWGVGIAMLGWLAFKIAERM